MRDVVVVGGGPVGLVAAMEAQLAGLQAVVVEPRPVPVDKACGEGLMPGALAALHRLGVDPSGHPFTGITYASADGSLVATHDFAGGPGRGVRRTVLHRALAERAAALGVRVVQGRVRDLSQDGASVRLLLDAPPAGPGARAGGRGALPGPGTAGGLGRPGALRGEGVRSAGAGGSSSTIDARWVIGADGLHSTVRRLVGADEGSDGRRYAVRRHAALAPWSSRVEVHWGATVEAYVTPVGPGEVGVAVEGPRAADLGLEAALAELPALAERLAGASWTSPPRGAGPLRQRAGARVVGRVLLVGDAAGYTDALTGEGLMMGMATARAAVEAVAAASACRLPSEADRALAGYEGEWRRLTRSYRWLTTALVGATRPRVGRSLVVPLAASAPWLFGAAVEQVGRTARPGPARASARGGGPRTASLDPADRP